MSDRRFFVSAKSAFVDHHTDAPIIAIVRGERGYYPIYSRASADTLNLRPLPADVAASAVAGSMFGWDCPAAKLARDYT